MPIRPHPDVRRRGLAPLWLLLACWVLFGAAPRDVAAQSGIDAATAVRRVKAAFLYRFVDYVEWPEAAFASAAAPVVIAVVGDDRLADELLRIVAGRTAGARPFTIRKLGGDVPATVGVHVLFRAGEGGRHPTVAAAAPVLVVGEADGALERGYTINFVLVDEHVRFDVSLGDADRRGLKLSSRLLAVAHEVVPAP
jgi:hypothetical protein